MKIIIDIGETNKIQRTVDVRIPAEQIAKVHLSLSFPDNIVGRRGYLRRHPLLPDDIIDPNAPKIDEGGIQKKSIPKHIEQMRRNGIFTSLQTQQDDEIIKFGSEPYMIAIPISDLVANLLRPSCQRLSDGSFRLYYFKDEPIDHVAYWCFCCFEESNSRSNLEFRQVRFEQATNKVRDVSSNESLNERALLWATASVPLVVDGQPLSAVEIARKNYDLRQIFGRDAIEAMQFVYKGWFTNWDERVEKAVLAHENSGQPFASFYHSILGIEESGNIVIRQQEGNLPELAELLAKTGIRHAGLLDSGGSCALYDVWLRGYLNHGWYFRIPRGSILLFELNLNQRIPIDYLNSLATKSSGGF